MKFSANFQPFFGLIDFPWKIGTMFFEICPGDKQTNKQTNKQINKQTYKETNKHR